MQHIVAHRESQSVTDRLQDALTMRKVSQHPTPTPLGELPQVTKPLKAAFSFRIQSNTADNRMGTHNRNRPTKMGLDRTDFAEH